MQRPQGVRRPIHELRMAESLQLENMIKKKVARNNARDMIKG